MFERFDPQARQAVVLAQEEARDLRHDYIGAQHLLLGVMRADEELAAVPPDTIRGLLEPGDADSPEQMPFSAVAKRALEQALREAIALGHRQISAAHILLSLASERAVRDLLARAGAEDLADRERTTARAAQVQRAASEPQPSGEQLPGLIGVPATDARLLESILNADGPVAAFLREHGVDSASLDQFRD